MMLAVIKVRLEGSRREPESVKNLEKAIKFQKRTIEFVVELDKHKGSATEARKWRQEEQNESCVDNWHHTPLLLQLILITLIFCKMEASTTMH